MLCCRNQKTKNPAVVLQDLLKFYFFAFLLQLCIFVLYVAKTNKHPASPRITAITTTTRVVNIFIAAAPTGAPTVIVAALTYCILHLKRRGLTVLLPEKIKTIADVELVCFDKTGTLTGTVVSPLPFSLQKPCPFLPVALLVQACCCVHPHNAVGAIAHAAVSIPDYQCEDYMS